MLIALYILAGIGLLMSLIGLPGIWVIFAATVISYFSVAQGVVPVWILVLYFLIAIIVSVIDNVIIALGAQKMGASKWGIVGAILGGIIGLLVLNLIGVLIGPFIGVVLMEIVMANKDVDSAVKAGIGTILGYLFSILIKFTASLIVVGSWLYLILR